MFFYNICPCTNEVVHVVFGFKPLELLYTF